MRNNIELHGYLGRDPELKEYNGPSGTFKKATFSVAVSRYKGDETDWFNCEVTGARAETAEKYLRKGSQILLWGRMESYDTKKEPSHKAWTVKVVGFDFCDKATKSGPETTGAPAAPATPAGPGSDPLGLGPLQEDDVPF